MDIFAFASQSEGFGQVLIEAMAAKKPVVASRISPITEIVSENETGLLTKAESSHALAEAIVTLAKNPEKARQMGMNGAKRVEKQFSADRMASKTIQLYQDVFKKT